MRWWPLVGALLVSGFFCVDMAAADEPPMPDSPPAGAPDEPPIPAPPPPGDEPPPPIDIFPAPTAPTADERDAFDAARCGPLQRPSMRPRFRLRVEAGATLIGAYEGSLGESVVGPSLDWDSLEPEASWGGRVALAYMLEPREQAEIRASWTGDWSDSSRETGAFGFSPPPDSQSPVTDATVRSEGSMWDVDLMYWWRGCNDCNRLDWGVGGRFIRLDETATVSDWTPLVGAGPGFLRSDALNEMFLVQGAGRYEATFGRFSLEALAAVFVGLNRQTADVNDVNILSGGSKDSSVDDDVFTWGGEFGLGVRYRFTGCWSISANYRLLYLGNVNRAHDSFDFSQAGTGAVQADTDSGDLLLHTVYLGLQFDF